VAALRALEARHLGVRELDPEQARAVEERAVEDEILYREALRLGLDRNDGIVRSRLEQKVLFLAEDMGGASREPTEEDLRSYFAKTQARWTEAAAVRFVHVFAAHEAAAEGLRDEVTAWSKTAAADGVPPFGESFPLARTVVARVGEVSARYGADFGDRVQKAPVGEWIGPIASKYGYHLVRVVERLDERPATFEESRSEVTLAYLIARREEATGAYLRQAFARYRVWVGDERALLPPTVARTAARGAASGED
jgi:hypothetical protein